MTPPATAEPTQYEVSCFPLDHDAHTSYALTVKYRSAGRWAITDLYGRYYDAEGQPGRRYDWLQPDLPADEQARTEEQSAEAQRRSDAWWEAHTFPRLRALQLAIDLAPLLQSMGRSVADAVAFYEELPS